MKSLHSMREEELKTWLIAHGEKPFRAGQILDWIYQKSVLNWDQMSNLGSSLKEKAAAHFQLNVLKLVKTVDSSDGETTKYLWELGDGKLVESVLIRSFERRTVCVSSQVGCPARCAFCASGKKGLIRNLSAAEIFEQTFAIDALLKKNGERVSHVVYMGMGEPFENYEEVVQSIQLLCDPARLGLSQRRITVSTVGVVEGITRFAEEELKVNLVLSLHAPNQRIRQKIIPYARKYALEEILSAMRYFTEKTRRDITYEYTLMSGINDGLDHAEELAQLLKGQQCTVNLIPYNPVDGLRLDRPPKEKIEAFRDLLDSRGLNVTWRYTKGKDIAAACGQLALQEKKG
ncbi:MAG: 23S rRNA (adenine(2503)-C(2))-methyltransferase RlmN [Chlamydiales bacterium]